MLCYVVIANSHMNVPFITVFNDVVTMFAVIYTILYTHTYIHTYNTASYVSFIVHYPWIVQCNDK
jgi:hypothetical protein